MTNFTKQEYLKQRKGTIIAFNTTTFVGTIAADDSIALGTENFLQVFFFGNNLSRLTSDPIVGMKVFFSYIELVRSEVWAHVVVENKD